MTDLLAQNSLLDVVGEIKMLFHGFGNRRTSKRCLLALGNKFGAKYVAEKARKMALYKKAGGNSNFHDQFDAEVSFWILHMEIYDMTGLYNSSPRYILHEKPAVEVVPQPPSPSVLQRVWNFTTATLHKFY